MRTPRLPGAAHLRAHARRYVVAVTVVALAASVTLLVGAARLTGSEAAKNKALTDAAATSRVSGEVGDALARIFSYTPDGVARTEQDAKDVLDGKAARQYESLFGQVREQVAEQKLTLATRVVSSGVTSLRGDRARLLFFLDQTTTREGRKPTTAAAQLSVSAERRDGDWRIVGITAR